MMAGQLEQTTLAFEVMLNSAEKAKQVVMDVRKYAASTPFGTDELIGATRGLTAYGIEAQQLLPVLKMLGDVSSAYGNDLPIRRLTYLFGTLHAQQRAYAIDIRQFANAGIPIYEELAKVLGKSKAELEQLVSDGRVSSKEVTQAFINMTSAGGRFYGLTERQGKTFLGQLEQLQDAVRLTQTAFGQMLIEEIGLGEATRDLGAFTSRIQGMIDYLRPGVRFIGDMTRAVIQFGWEGARAFGTVANFGAEAFGRTFPGLKDAAHSFHQLVKDAANFKIDDVKLINFAADAAEAAVKTFATIADTISRLFDEATKRAEPVLRVFERIDQLMSKEVTGPGPGGPMGKSVNGGLLFGGINASPLNGRRDGDPINADRIAPPVAGMSAARVMREYGELRLRHQQFRNLVDDNERNGRGGLLADAAKAEFDRANNDLNAFEGGFVRHPQFSTRHLLDRGQIPPILGTPGDPALNGAAAAPTFMSKAQEALDAMREAMLAPARQRKLDAEADQRRKATEALSIFSREVLSSGMALHDLGVLNAQLNRQINLDTALAGGPLAVGRAFGTNRGGHGVVVPDVNPRLDELTRELTSRFDPRRDLNIYKEELEQLRKRSAFGESTNQVVELAWREKLNEVGGKLGIPTTSHLPDAVTAGSVEDARLINAWKTNPNLTTEQLLSQILEVVKMQLGLQQSEKIPVGGTAPMPRPVIVIPAP